jgi:hypothetical protein
VLGAPASVRQEQELVASRAGIAPESAALAWRFDGPLKPSTVEYAIRHIVERQDILRTRLVHSERGVMQVVDAGASVEFAAYSLPRPKDGGSAVLIRKLSEDAVETPFLLTRAPMFRSALFRIGATESALIITVAHSIWDAWSTRVFSFEFTECYAAFTNGRRPELPPMAVQFADVTTWESRRPRAVTAETYSARIGLWRARNSALGVTADESIVETAADVPLRALSYRLLTRFDNIATEVGASTPVAMLAALAVLAYASGWGDSILLGFNTANRDRPEKRALIGCLLEHRPLLLDLTGQPNWRELVSRTALATRLYAQEGMTLRSLFPWLPQAPPPDRTACPAIINYVPWAYAVESQLIGVGKSRAGSPTITDREFPHVAAWERTHFIATLTEAPPPASLTGVLRYNPRLVSHAQARYLVLGFHDVVRQAVDAPELRLGRLVARLRDFGG